MVYKLNKTLKTNKLFIFLTVIEIIYIFYMLNIYKTYYFIHHPFEPTIIKNLSSYFKHPISVDEYSNKVCPFGHMASKLLIIYLIIRYILYKNKYNLTKINFIILGFTILLSFMNMNVVIYLLPYYIAELYIIYYIL